MNAWTIETTFNFIELYKNEACIWNPKHKYHKDKVKVSEAWNRISEIMDVPVADLKRKKEALLAAFRLNHRKYLRSQNSSDEEAAKPIWMYYEALASFMSDVYECKSVNTSEITDYDKEECIVLEEEEILNQSSPGDPLVNYSFEKSSSTSELVDIGNDLKNTLSTINDTLKKRMKKEDTYDDCELFGRLLAKKLRYFNELDRQDLMYEIDGLIIKKRRSSSSSNFQYD